MKEKNRSKKPGYRGVNNWVNQNVAYVPWPGGTVTIIHCFWGPNKGRETN